MRFEAYCDESTGTHERESKFYVVAGYMATDSVWRAFEADWAAALRDEGIGEFHQTDCDRGYGAFAHLRGSEHGNERERIQRQFLSIIKKHPIFGVSTAVVLNQFHRHSPKLEVLLERQLNKPYMHAFRGTLHTFCDQIRERPGNLRIDFVFDRHPQYGGRSEVLFRSIAALDASRFKWRNRLGGFSRSSRFDSMPLQAADILSYETFRRLERGGAERWQYTKLVEGGQVLHRTMGSQFFRRLIFNMNNALKKAGAE